MLIDWFTVGAQFLNFFILVWLMKRFLYKPILNAIDARERRIATELANANAKMAEAQREHDEFLRKNEEFDRQRASRMSQVTDEVKDIRQKLLDEVRETADTLSAKRMETLRNDARNLNNAICLRTQQEVFSIARRALMDLASTSLEERLADVFIRRIREMDDQAKTGLAHALKSDPDRAIVRSAYDLPAEERTTIEAAIHDVLEVKAQLRFVTSPDLISGIELITNGQKVAWSISDYLVSLEKGVDELLKMKAKSKADTGPDPRIPDPVPETTKQESVEHGT